MENSIDRAIELIIAESKEHGGIKSMSCHGHCSPINVKYLDGHWNSYHQGYGLDWAEHNENMAKVKEIAKSEGAKARLYRSPA